jgi:protein gp37
MSLMTSEMADAAEREKLCFNVDNKCFDIRGYNKVSADPFPYGFAPTFHRYRLDEPAKLKKPSRIFVCSMADLFGDWVPDQWIREVFKACEAAPWHTYIFLTKNPERYSKINGRNHQYNWDFAKNNWWLGLTITNNKDLPKLKHLPYGQTNTFISIEPIQCEIDLSFYFPATNTKCQCSYCGHYTNSYSLHCHNCSKEGGYSGSFRKDPINWVIVGAETGNRKGKIIPERSWIEDIVNQCRMAKVPVFMKGSLADIWGEPLIQEWPQGLEGDGQG